MPADPGGRGDTTAREAYAARRALALDAVDRAAERLWRRRVLEAIEEDD